MAPRNPVTGVVVAGAASIVYLADLCMGPDSSLTSDEAKELEFTVRIRLTASSSTNTLKQQLPLCSCLAIAILGF